MTSQSQIAANRANAQLSTGPRTEAGKSVAARNARKHGLSSTQLVIAGPDELEAFESMRQALAEELVPHGELESSYFDTILHANWNIRRGRLLEAQLMAEGETDPILDEQNEAKLRQLDRHARRHEANFNRAINQLRLLQTERAFRDLARPTAAAQNEPKPAVASPLADTQKARQSHLRVRIAKARIDAVSLGLALDRFMIGPPATEAA